MGGVKVLTLVQPKASEREWLQPDQQQQQQQQIQEDETGDYFSMYRYSMTTYEFLNNQTLVIIAKPIDKGGA